ncbi:hypothetical protein ACTHQ4_14905 [Alkalicoccobacillus gibsonii]|uniref:hypothetical protein n=1 Tax=Alkalicoccobacillus gibsonii TaxID=79881 RepID=UPI003F7BA835
MKKTLKITAITAITLGVLIACSDNEDANDSSSEPNNEEASNDSENDDDNTSTTEEPVDEGSNEGLPEKSDFKSDDESDKESEDGSGPNLGEGDTEDQLELKIGDTGQIETTINMIEVTLTNVSIEESIKDATPERDYFLVADINLKNLADDPMDITEAIGVLELTGDLEGGGGPDFSGYYDAIEPMEGSLESGQEIEGQLLFEENDFEEYYIRVNEGLIAAGGAKNQAIWTFKKEEAE